MTAKMNKKIAVTGIIAFIMLLSISSIIFCFQIKPVMAYNLNSYDLIDGGKHMDWDGSTKYGTAWSESVNVWNGHKSGMIRPDAWNRIEDVKISDYSESSNIVSMSSSNGKIKFNTLNMDKYSSSKQKGVIIHTIGHCLGIDNNNSISSVMSEKYNATSLNQDDKDALDWLYKNRY